MGTWPGSVGKRSTKLHRSRCHANAVKRGGQKTRLALGSLAGLRCLDGNPVFFAQDPLSTVEKVGPYTATFHLRHPPVCESTDGIAIRGLHWVRVQPTSSLSSPSH